MLARTTSLCKVDLLQLLPPQAPAPLSHAEKPGLGLGSFKLKGSPSTRESKLKGFCPTPGPLHSHCSLCREGI